MICLKRIYEPKSDDDGLRVLVDRLWPRGIRKQDAEIDLWLKDIAPSPELRQWFDHDPVRWSEFNRRYRAELLSKKEALAELREKARGQTVTLVYAAKDVEHNQAVVLREVLSSGP
ncbi:DUF488 domain-containing protein [Mesorhizobium sp. L-8-3]|uniref:DUF488 domain-containing protein n=1 Tax=Mesorhizobium sp. L-8-3 TaxID=2744522 RepID=UPI001927791D|nr:DUF488 domain-containing protein [Mesorhizobium sp. L-8-3]BCH25497.1 hypothetical protein MesoLjLb_52820 [Mesorhizobium sp. L-8-3]